MDPLVCKDCCDESLKNLIELCVRCLSNDRPSIDDVLWNLEFVAQTHTSSVEEMSSNEMSANDKIVCIAEEVE